VFVTHGGLGSLVESIYHKARIVGVPLSNDQKPNLLRAERHGYAVSLDWDDITADQLVASIRKAMEDKEMAASLERIHTLYMDRPERPVDKVASSCLVFAGRLVGRVCLSARRRRLAQVHWRGCSLLPVPPP